MTFYKNKNKNKNKVGKKLVSANSKVGMKVITGFTYTLTLSFSKVGRRGGSFSWTFLAIYKNLIRPQAWSRRVVLWSVRWCKVIL